MGGDDDEAMSYRAGAFAFDDVTDKGAAGRAEHLKLPPTRKACRDRKCVLTESESLPDGMIRAWCPHCRFELTHSMYQWKREGRESR